MDEWTEPSGRQISLVSWLRINTRVPRQRAECIKPNPVSVSYKSVQVVNKIYLLSSIRHSIQWSHGQTKYNRKGWPNYWRHDQNLGGMVKNIGCIKMGLFGASQGSQGSQGKVREKSGEKILVREVREKSGKFKKIWKSQGK